MIYSVRIFWYHARVGFRSRMAKDPYRNSAKLYDLFVGTLNTALKRERRRLAPPAPGKRVLDIGCGTGADLGLYRRSGCEVAGVDLSPAMLAVARRRLGDSADLRMCSGKMLSFPDCSFDLVLATYLLHELPSEDRPAVIREMMRVVKREGRILLTDYLPGPFRFPLGWINAMVIYIFERAAGRTHFENGRDFLRRGGLTGLVRRSGLRVVVQKPVGGGAIGFSLLSL
jgi:ubiquinone/menaquinone biosynthesis C-methylase UbiE